MSPQFSLGKRLRVLRKERRLTQRELANQASISVNAVSLIERDEISPSVTTLQSLAGALQIKISYFFDETIEKEVVYLKSVDRPALTSGNIIIEGTGRKLRGQQLEFFFVTLKPHAESGSRQVIHSGHEFVYCLTGQVAYTVDDKSYTLESGDILLFEAALPHHWHNPTDQPVQLLLILQTPDEMAEPVRHHFPEYPSLAHIQ